MGNPELDLRYGITKENKTSVKFDVEFKFSNR